MKKSILVGCIFVSIITGITIGIIAHVYNDNTLEKASLHEIEKINELNKQENIITTGKIEEKTSPNCEITFETHYNECGHTEIEHKEVENKDVNKNEEYFKNKYNEWKIKKFSGDEINLYKEINAICKKHYIIKEKDGYIAVYTIDLSGNQELKEVTDIYTKYLPDEDIVLLKKGIKANGDNELRQKLGDFE